MGFLDLFMVALMPVIKVLLVTAVGLFSALDRVHLLGPTAKRNLNNMVFYLFSPCLVATKLANTITLEDLMTLWFMPVNILLTFVIGSALAWILIKLTKTPRHLQSLVIGCCASGNLGNLPLIIIPAVCDEKNSPFADSSTCSTYGEAYASLSMAIGVIYIWSYVYTIMRVSSSNTKTAEEEEAAIVAAADLQGTTSSADDPESTMTNYKEPLLIINSGDINDNDDKSNEQKPSHIVAVLRNIDIKKLFAPSTIAAMIGFTIGAVSPIRNLLIGNDAALHVIYTSADLLGGAAIPCITLVIGANLLKGLQQPKISGGLVMGVILIRYAALPVIGIGIVKGAEYVGIVGSDSLYRFTLMLQYALPPAMNVGTITQLLGAGESECSVIMLWTYVIAAFTLTLWSTFFMWLVS